MATTATSLFGTQVDLNPTAEKDGYEVGHGHIFMKKTFHKPTYCHHCTDMLWGLIGQGFICEVCNFVSHERCLENVISPCSSIASNLIKDPVAHTWGEPDRFKKKFCNVCRRSLGDCLALRCEVCEYYAHAACQDFAVSDCLKIACYDPNKKETSSQVVFHHWREGNLPANAKCLVCKKTSASTECIASKRCEWCGVTSHTGCYRSISPECNYGPLREILTLPNTVSMPKTNYSVKSVSKSAGDRVPVHVGFSQFFTDSPSDTTSDPDTTSACSSPNSSLDGSPTRRKKNDNSQRQRSTILQGFLSLFTSKKHEAAVEEEESVNEPDEVFSLCVEGLITLSHPAAGSDGTVIRLFDGNLSFKRRVSRTISVPKDATTHQILEAALKAYQISEDPRYYYLAEITEAGSHLHERRLKEGEHSSNLGKNNRDGRPPSLFLRYEEKDLKRGTIRVYPGTLRVPVAYKSISINNFISVEEVIEMALHKFGLEDEDPKEYNLVEVVLDKGVQDRVMDREECPWPQLVEARRYPGHLEMLHFYDDPQPVCTENYFPKWIMSPPKILSSDVEIVVLLENSLRKMKQTRYYLRKIKERRHDRSEMYVGNLPINLSDHRYKQIFQKTLADVAQFTLGAVYAQNGACVLVFEDVDEAESSYHILKEATVDDKSLIVLFVPEIHPERLDEDSCPLLVFVNVKSGGCQGVELIQNVKKLVNPHQVFDLDQGGPLPGLHVFSQLKKYRLLICGGDGTVGWVLSVLDDMSQESVCSRPPIAILPLGTGNDLARTLKWGGGYEYGDDIYPILRAIVDAEEIKLDRWTVIFEPDGKLVECDNKSNSSTSSSGNDDMPNMFVMNNYFGIGIDADVCLAFHLKREENPEKFQSRIYNKGVYFKVGVRKMMQRERRSCKDLYKDLRVEVDGQRLELPPLEGIILLNIGSWGSGADIWGQDDDGSGRWKKSSPSDGNLEVVGLTGIVHMGQIQSGLRTGVRLAQGSHIRIWMNSDMPVQVDGEPWMQLAGQVVITRSALQATMLKKAKIQRRNTDPQINC
ncbi:diacylglycerol kinase theta-like isoform X3 [Ptychodera flava]|uniref:diacylglycerol kinase theta-like isoform X3 n=1 Tax=Ptychodera flava TaxID=63121 RepID=UPI00396A16AB